MKQVTVVCKDCSQRHRIDKRRLRGFVRPRCPSCQGPMEQPGVPRQQHCELCGKPITGSSRCTYCPECGHRKFGGLSGE